MKATACRLKGIVQSDEYGWLNGITADPADQKQSKCAQYSIDREIYAIHVYFPIFAFKNFSILPIGHDTFSKPMNHFLVLRYQGMAKQF